MNADLDRKTTQLADQYLAGRMSRRAFVSRLMALGLAPSVVGAIVAACGSSATPTPPPVATPAGTSAPPSSTAPSSASPSPMDLKGNVRFLIGPWSDQEVQHHQHIAQGFQAIYPNVTFDFRLYQWDTAAQEINTSVQAGAHDIYMTTESSYPDYEASGVFTDLTSRITDPSFASELSKYLYMDRIKAYGPKILGLPISWHVEDAMFVNMDMVQAAGYDEHFADTWDTFLACVTKMTKPGTYGFGIGIQLGGYGEWYQRLRAAGGSYLTPDLSAPNVNHPDVVTATQQFADLFKQGIAPPLGTYTYDNAPAAFAAGKMAIYSSDLASTTVLPSPVPFTWALVPYPPGPQTRVNFNDLSIYMVNAKSADQDLMWEVVKWWCNGPNDAYWADNSGTYPARTDAADNGYGTNAAPQLAASFADFQKYAVGLEDFPAWGDVESLAEAEIQNCYAGKESAQDAVNNVEKIVKQEVGL